MTSRRIPGISTSFAGAAALTAVVLGGVVGCASKSFSSKNPPPPDAPPPAAAPAPPPPAPPMPAPAASPDAPSAATSPAVAEILRLKDAGYTEDFLLNHIRSTNQTYHLSVDDLIALRRAGLSETVIDAMERSGAPAAAPAAEAAQPVARHAEFDGLVRQKAGFLFVGGSKSKEVGKFVIDGERVNWYQMVDPEANFSVTERNIKELWMNCAPRAGENLCLELCFKSFSGQEACFRDAGWENGDNRQVTAMYDYFQKAFPNTFFSKREKKSF